MIILCFLRLCLATRLSHLSLSLVGFEEASCPKSYSQRNSVSNLREFGSRDFASPVADETTAPAEIQIAA